MGLIISFLLVWLIGTFVFWLVGFFSPSPPPLVGSAIGAFIIEIFAIILRFLPWLFFYPFLILVIWILLIKIANIEKAYGFFGAIFYIVIREIIFFFLFMRFFY